MMNRPMIKRVRVYNFKSLANTDVSFGPTTVMIGRSGSGKTNFVDAMRFLRDYLVTRSFKGWVPNNEWGPILCATLGDRTAFWFDVDFSVPSHPGDFRYRLQFIFEPHAQNAPSVGEEYLLHDGNPVFH